MGPEQRPENREQPDAEPTPEMVNFIRLLILRPEMRRRQDKGFIFWEATQYDFRPEDVTSVGRTSEKHAREGLA